MLATIRALVVYVLVCSTATVSAFSPKILSASRSRVGTAFFAVETGTVTDDDTVAANGLMKRDRYVATNRFAVRKGQQAKFEKRWASRKSRLAELEGFKYFHLMRRVSVDGSNPVYDEGEADETAMENYVSFTIWEKKSHFSAWRTGDAFKEAHGGTSIGAFLSTMINSAMVLRGPPRPAFYDGLFTQSKPPTKVAATVGGWRNVEADGVSTLPPECLVAFEKYFVPIAMASSFEQFWSSSPKEQSVTDADGFVATSLMRRDVKAKGHGMGEFDSNEPTYVAVRIFEDLSSFLKWKNSEESKVDVPSGIMSKDPVELTYEGTLVINTKNGA